MSVLSVRDGRVGAAGDAVGLADGEDLVDLGADVVGELVAVDVVGATARP